mmetsp:Transcript_37216/g.119339  ORF Transcript_37216/g.119339 Transcript_37216/m.119339 type:complete len:354 (-) Transcript_37216:93-1154(-)
MHVLAEHRHTLDAGPAADGRLPPEDRVEHRRVRRDPHVSQQDAPRQPHALLDDAAGPDRDVWPNEAVGADLRALVDQHRALDLSASVELGAGCAGELVRCDAGEVLQVEGVALQEVARLLDVHPVALEGHRVELLLRRELRQHLALHRHRPHDPQPLDKGGREDVDARVDQVAGEGAAVLDEALNQARGVRLHDRLSVLCRLVDSRHHDGAQLAVRLVQRVERAQVEVAGDVAVDDEERLAVAEQAALVRQRDRPGRAERLVLLHARDLDAEAVLVLIEKASHDLRAVVDGEHHLIHAGAHERLDEVQQQRLVSKLDERFRFGEREWPQLRTETADENQPFWRRVRHASVPGE